MNTNRALYHEIVKLSNGKRELHIWVYGIDLTKGQRTLADKTPEVIKEDHDFFEVLLNEKAQEEVEADPKWVITTLSDWRSWASSFISEFYEKQDKDIAKQIIDARDKYLNEK